MNDDARISEADREFLERLVLAAQRADAALQSFVTYLSQKYDLKPEQRIMLSGLIARQLDQEK